MIVRIPAKSSPRLFCLWLVQFFNIAMVSLAKDEEVKITSKSFGDFEVQIESVDVRLSQVTHLEEIPISEHKYVGAGLDHSLHIAFFTFVGDVFVEKKLKSVNVKKTRETGVITGFTISTLWVYYTLENELFQLSHDLGDRKLLDPTIGVHKLKPTALAFDKIKKVLFMLAMDHIYYTTNLESSHRDRTKRLSIKGPYDIYSNIGIPPQPGLMQITEGKRLWISFAYGIASLNLTSKGNTTKASGYTVVVGKPNINLYEDGVLSYALFTPISSFTTDGDGYIIVTTSEKSLGAVRVVDFTNRKVDSACVHSTTFYGGTSKECALSRPRVHLIRHKDQEIRVLFSVSGATLVVAKVDLKAKNTVGQIMAICVVTVLLVGLCIVLEKYDGGFLSRSCRRRRGANTDRLTDISNQFSKYQAQQMSKIVSQHPSRAVSAVFPRSKHPALGTGQDDVMGQMPLAGKVDGKRGSMMADGNKWRAIINHKLLQRKQHTAISARLEGRAITPSPTKKTAYPLETGNVETTPSKWDLFKSMFFADMTRLQGIYRSLAEQTHRTSLYNANMAQKRNDPASVPTSINQSMSSMAAKKQVHADYTPRRVSSVEKNPAVASANPSEGPFDPFTTKVESRKASASQPTKKPDIGNDLKAGPISMFAVVNQACPGLPRLQPEINPNQMFHFGKEKKDAMEVVSGLGAAKTKAKTANPSEGPVDPFTTKVESRKASASQPTKQPDIGDDHKTGLKSMFAVVNNAREKLSSIKSEKTLNRVSHSAEEKKDASNVVSKAKVKTDKSRKSGAKSPKKKQSIKIKQKQNPEPETGPTEEQPAYATIKKTRMPALQPTPVHKAAESATSYYAKAPELLPKKFD